MNILTILTNHVPNKAKTYGVHENWSKKGKEKKVIKLFINI